MAWNCLNHLSYSGNSQGLQLEDVDIQFHASCGYICNYLCLGLAKVKNIMETMETAKLILESIGLLLAVVTIWQAWKTYRSHQQTEYHKLFSQLNRRYEKNGDIQTVIKFLREKEPEGDYITLYQMEVFLRFFEELGLYMSTDSLETQDVDEFFGFYLRQLYKSSKGKALLARLGEEEKKLELLQVVKEKLDIR